MRECPRAAAVIALSAPDRPDLEQLKRTAKQLLRTAQAGDPVALARFRALPSFAHATEIELAHAPLALHDAQSVVAREHSVASWNALREHVEELTLQFDAAVSEFVAAATDGRAGRAERLFALSRGWDSTSGSPWFIRAGSWRMS